MMNKYIITSIILLFSITIFGQSLQLATMSEVGQINLTNPANMATKRFYLGVSPFPRVGTSLGGSQLYQANGSYLPGFIDLEGVADDNFISANISLPFSMAFKIKKWGFNLHSKSVLNSQIGFNKDFLGFVTQGNGAYVGETLNLDPKFDISMYQEFGIGVSREILKIFNVGVRGKYLVGLANVNTVDGNLSLETAPEFYQLRAEADYTIQLAGIPTLNNLSDYAVIDSFFNEIAANPLNSYSNLTQNRGFAFDIGATMNIGKMLHVGVSVLDIGRINWEENSSEYKISGQFQFDGIDAAGFLTGDDLANIVDTLDQIVTLTSKPTTYSTSINPKIYVTARMKFGKEFYLNGVFRSEFTSQGAQTAFGVGCQKNFKRILSVGAMYSIRNGSFANLGANMSLKLGPAQVFILSDNILPIISQWQATNTNVRFGVNVTINDKRKE
jgi:hypothetical protein